MKVDRKPHILKENKTSGYPRNMIFFDVESKLERVDDKIIHKPYLFIGYWYCFRYEKGRHPSEQWYYSENSEDFWNWVVSKVNKKEALYMFAHNPTYDLVAGSAFLVLKAKGFTITRFYEKGRTFILEFKGDKRKIVVFNVGNFYQGSVADIGKAFNLPKLEMDYENPTMEQALTYCKRDVEIIAKAILTWIKFCKENDLGNFGVTAPKQAFNAYRHRFMKHKIFIHNNVDAIEIERESYYGGRTEAFYIGHVADDKVFTLDVNSMYPSVMKEGLYPTKLVSIRDNLSPGGLKYVINDYAVCARVRVKTDIPCVPCRIGKKLFFPVGEFVTTLATPEIELVFRYGEILEVYQAALYNVASLFADFVDFFYNARLEAKKEGNRANDLLFKLILNSLYGKFGQKGGDWEIIGETDKEGAGYEEVYDLTEGKWITYKWFNGVLLAKKDEKEGYDSFPAIAAHVTSYARCVLFEYIYKAGFENVYYCDTDSLFVNKKGVERLNDVIDKDKLGFLKYEGEKDNLIIYGAKDYVWSNGEKHKGIPKSAIKIGDNKWSYTFWPRISTLIRHNSIDKYYNVIMEKELRRQYLKGWITESGRVVPFEVKVSNGKNCILPWVETNYCKKGLRLADDEQIIWVAREYKL
jgi:DNA polymerase type B, organellar and viral.